MLVHKSHTTKTVGSRLFCTSCGCRHSALAAICDAPFATGVKPVLNSVRLFSQALDGLKANPLQHYAGLPGLTSWLISNGVVRMFDSERDTEEFIVPHSHRYDFTCLVVEGRVTNILYTEIGGETPAPKERSNKEMYVGKTTPAGESVCLNKYAVGVLHGSAQIAHGYFRGTEPRGFEGTAYTYTAGDVYHMKHSEIHAIKFAAGTRVLFLEGPQVVDKVVVLEPWANGAVVPTFKVEPWMYSRPGSAVKP